MIILSLYGVTTGLELVQIPLSNIPSSLKFENAWIEITERQILTSSEKDSFVVFRKIVGSNVVTWIGLYRPAFEIGGNRSGSFYGAGAWIVDCVTDVRVLVEVLKDLADQIQSTSMSGGRFIKRIADSQNEIKLPTLVSSLNSNLTKVAGGCHPSGDIALIVSNGNVNEIIDWSQRAKSAFAFSKIFIVSAEQLPGQSNQTSFAVHRSLSLAIESAYHRLGNDLQAARNELASTNQKLNKLKEEESNLISDIHNLEFTLSNYDKNISNFNVEIDRQKKNYEQTIFSLNAEIDRLNNKTNYDKQKISQYETKVNVLNSNALQNKNSELQPSKNALGMQQSLPHSKDPLFYNANIESEEIDDNDHGMLFTRFFIGLLVIGLVVAIVFAFLRYKTDSNNNSSTPVAPSEAPHDPSVNNIDENESKSSIENPVAYGINKVSPKVDQQTPETKSSNSIKNQSSQDQKESNSNVGSVNQKNNSNIVNSEAKKNEQSNNKTSSKNYKSSDKN